MDRRGGGVLGGCAHRRLPEGTDVESLATYVLAVMEGGVMLSRSYGSVEPFDRTVRGLEEHFRLLVGSGRR